MIWQNYDRLVQHLEGMDRAQFAYGSNDLDKRANCVACQIVDMVPDHPKEWIGPGNVGSTEAIRAFLGVTDQETSYLYGRLNTAFDPPTPVGTYSFCPLRGELGIAEALRRLAIVAARYPRPAETEVSEPASIFQPNEQAFLDSIRSLVASAEIGR